jgi:hypothetical protein
MHWKTFSLSLFHGSLQMEEFLICCACLNEYYPFFIFFFGTNWKNQLQLTEFKKQSFRENQRKTEGISRNDTHLVPNFSIDL